MKRHSDLVASLVLALSVVVLYFPVVSLFWTYDDPFHLNLVAKYDAVDYLFRPQFWRELPFRMFTPLQMISYDVDWSLFGFDARAFYLHQLIAMAIATLTLYGAARLWFHPLESACIAAFFAFGVPTISWVQQLMVRHYIEGLIFAALSLMTFVFALRRESMQWAVVSALCALLAMLEKEVYIPLPLLFFTIREGTWRARLRYLTPGAIALVAYFGWRIGMLGTFTGGYGWAIERKDVPLLLAGIPAKLGAALGGNSLAGRVVLVIFFAGFVFTALRSRWSVIALALAIFPFLPVSTVMERRYTALVWLIFAVAFVHACAVAILPRRRLWILGLTAVLILVANRIEWRHELERMALLSREAEFYLRLPSRDVMAKPTAPPNTMANLQKLKRETLRAREAAGWYYDDLYLCDRPIQGKIWTLREGEPREITREASAAAPVYCGSIRHDAGLFVKTYYSDEALFWELGPYDNGRYAFVLDGGAIRYNMPRAAGFQIGKLPAIAFRVRYEHPEGWVTYSPELRMELKNGARLEWSR